jgi:hypothetical protein
MCGGERIGAPHHIAKQAADDLKFEDVREAVIPNSRIVVASSDDAPQ